MWASRFNHRTRVSCWAPRLNSNTWYNFTILKVLTLCSSFCSEILLRPLDQEKSFRTYWWCRPLLSFQPAKDCPCIYRHKWGMPSLFNQGYYLYFAGTYLRREIWIYRPSSAQETSISLWRRNWREWRGFIRRILQVAPSNWGHHFFLSNMEWMFPLSYLQSASLPRYMDWDLVRAPGIVVERISNRAAFPNGHSREILALFPDSMKTSFQQARLLSKRQLSSANLWKWRVNSLNLTSEHLGGYTWRRPLVGEDRLLCPQRIGGTPTPVRAISCSQGRVLQDYPELL